MLSISDINRVSVAEYIFITKVQKHIISSHLEAVYLRYPITFAPHTKYKTDKFTTWLERGKKVFK